MIFLGIVVLILALFFLMRPVGDGEVESLKGEEFLDEVEFLDETVAVVPDEVLVLAPVSDPVDDVEIDFDFYNYDFVDEEIKTVLSSMVSGEKSVFHLPPTGYVNVSRGSEYGIAYALHNPNPSGDGVDWENYNDFEYNWNVDESVEEDCGVGVGEAQGWIEMGSYSWGKMAHGWVDHLPVYFSFPSDVEPCVVRYDFEVLRDGVIYDSETVEFNLI